MFLYRFVRRRRRPQILVHAIIFEQLFGFLSFLAQLLALAYRSTDYILVDFRRDLDLEFSRSNIELAISQPKMVRLPRNKKQTRRLNSKLQMWPLGLTLAMTLTLNFKVKYRIGYISAINGAIATKRKPYISIDLRTSNVTIGFDFGHDLDLGFSRSNI